MTVETEQVRLLPDEEFRDLREAVRGFLEKRCDEPAVRTAMGSDLGHDPAVWRQLAQQLGVVGVDVPERLGGAGGTVADVAVVAQEVGRAAAPMPYLSTAVLAAGALLHSGDDQACAEHLPGLCDGTSLAALAVAADDGSWSCAPVEASADDDGGWRLSGHAPFVIDGASADLLLVAARTRTGISLFAVDGGASGLVRQPVRTLDLTRRVATLTLEAVPAQLVGAEGQAGPVLDRVRTRALVVLAAEQLGVAERTLETAVAYARQRLQFGRPIGSFQAVKHRCADMALQVDAAQSAVAWAVAAAAQDSPDLEVAALAAAATSGDAAVFCSAENVQVHGGIGFTWEHFAHLYFRRARSAALLLGSPAQHREELLVRLGL